MFKKGRLESILLAFGLLLAMPGLTASGSASAQVRSTIQASARVVEAGPAWAAHRDLQSAVGELTEAARLTGLRDGSVILTDRAEGSASIASRVRVVRFGPDTQQGAAGPRALVDADLFSDDPRSGPIGVRDPEGSPVRTHVVVYVEHVAN